MINGYQRGRNTVCGEDGVRGAEADARYVGLENLTSLGLRI